MHGSKMIKAKSNMPSTIIHMWKIMNKQEQIHHWSL